MVRRAYDERRHLPRHVRGLVLPQRGLQGAVRPPRDRDRDAVPEPPGRARSSGCRSATGSSASRPTRTGCSPTTRRTPTSSSRSTGATRCSASSARASRTSRSAAPVRSGASRSRSREDGETAQREDGSWDPEAGVDLRLVRRPDQLHHRGRVPRRHGRLPPLVAGRPPRHRQGHRRGSTRSTGRRCCGRPGIEPPRQVWVHGWLLAAGERMSKSRGNFLDPHAVVAAFGADGARYVTLREVAFDKDTDVSAGTRSCAATTPTSRTTSATSSTGRSRWSTGTWTASGRRRAGRATPPSAEGWADTLRAVRAAARRLPAPRRAGRAVGVRPRCEPDGRRGAALDAEQGRRRRATRRPRRGSATCSATSSRPAGSSGWPSPRSCRRRRRGSSASWGTPFRMAPTATAGRRPRAARLGRRSGPGPGHGNAGAPVPQGRERGCRTRAGLIVDR